MVVPRAARSRIRGRTELALRDLRLARNFKYDWSVFRRHSGVIPALRQAEIEALITMEYHRIEKGLALAAPRPRFGAEAIASLLRLLDDYVKRPHWDKRLVVVSLAALDQYLDYHITIGVTDFHWKDQLTVFRDLVERDPGAGGTRTVRPVPVDAESEEALERFFLSRHSVRHFSNGAVGIGEIRRAVALAQRTPSVCNRQSARVHIYSEPSEKQAVLALQNGNRGFGEYAAAVLIVTVEIGSFVSVGERNQGWVDGGMFASTLLWALHALGLGACALNCSNEAEVDARLHDTAGIPLSEQIITMIAVGRMPGVLEVARSDRLPLDRVVVDHRTAGIGSIADVQ